MNRKLAAVSLFALGSALVLPACVGGSSDVSKQEKERLKAYILDKVPPNIPIKLNVNYDNKVTLIGARVEPAGTLRPGQQVKVTMYWRSDKKLPDGWNLFTHILDGSGERIMNIDNVGPLREWHDSHQVLWPSAWTPGKIYVDEQTFNVPSKLKTNKIQLVTGIWKGNDRLKTLSGPHDSQNRGIVVNLTTTVNETPGRTLANASVPMLRVDKLEKGETIKIDGKLDDAAWKTAPVAGPFVDVNTGKPNTSFPVNGSVKVAWDDQGLYLGFDIQDPDIIGGFKPGAKDPHLWTKDTVEIMIDPDGDGDNKDYYEIQINPQNLVFDTQYDTYNEPRKLPNGPFGHEEWSSHVQSAVTVNGTIDKPGDKDKGYVVEAMIPWKSFTLAKHAPPRPGDTWRVNFYAMKNNGGVAWSPILRQGNFHKASRFGRILWADKGWHPPGMAHPLLKGPMLNPAMAEHLKAVPKK
jgi:Carbohydrate family 9 binding domain-like